MGWRWRLIWIWIDFFRGPTRSDAVIFLRPSNSDTTCFFFFFDPANPTRRIGWMFFPFEGLYTTYTATHDIQHTPYTAMAAAAAALDVERLNALFVPSANSKR